MKREYREKKENKWRKKFKDDYVSRDIYIRNINTNAYKKSGGLACIWREDSLQDVNVVNLESKQLQLIKIKANKESFNIINIYTPIGKVGDTNNFINHTIKNFVIKQKIDMDHTIVCRDFNVTIDPKVNWWSNLAKTTNTKVFLSLIKLIEKLKLQDIWRNRNKI